MGASDLKAITEPENFELILLSYTVHVSKALDLDTKAVLRSELGGVEFSEKFTGLKVN